MPIEIPNSATGVTNLASGADPMARSEETPDLATLQAEIQYAWDMLPDDDTAQALAYKECIRYAWWEGQSPDGLKHTQNMGKAAQPYDRAPDSRIMLADDVCNSLVDVLYAAFFKATLKVAPWTASSQGMTEAAELRAVVNWMLGGPLMDTLIDDVEFAAQVMVTLGHVVIQPTWHKEKILRERTLTLDMITQVAAQAAGPPQSNPGEREAHQDLLARAPEMLMDPQQEDAAAELMMLFAPVTKTEARTMVRELRRDKQTTFAVAEDGPSVPEVNVLVPGQHFVQPPESTALKRRGRWKGVRVFLPESRLRARGTEEGLNEQFVEAACKTKGMSIDTAAVETAEDANLKDIEIFYIYQHRVDDKGVPGIWCTVLSMHVKATAGKETAAAEFGKHWQLDLGQDDLPFVIPMLEVTGLRPQDSRGIPEQLNTQQNEIKTARDGLFIYQQLTITPPLKRRGTAATKLAPEFGPLAQFQDNTGQDWTWFNPPPGSPEIALKLTGLVQKESEDRFGVPRADTPGQRWQLRQMRLVMRWLGAWSQVYRWLAVMGYKTMTPAQLEEILGHPPLLNAEKISRYNLRLWYDTRAGDGEWIEKLVGWIEKILQSGGATGMNIEKLVNLLLRYIDPDLYEEVASDPPGNKLKIYRDAREELNNVMLGNKALPVEKDPTAKMKLAIVQNLVKSNPKYQETLQKDEGVAQNLKTYMGMLQHSYQETVLSKAQGRLGVADVGQENEG